MKYWLYRLKKEEYEKIKDKRTIQIDYINEEVDEKDKFIVHVSGLGILSGAYRLKDDFLIAEKLSEKKPRLSEFYSKLSFIDFVNERTYKLFAKKIKQIIEEDYKILKEGL